MWHDNVDLLAYHDLDGRSGFNGIDIFTYNPSRSS
jgi:hypothetical protein